MKPDNWNRFAAGLLAILLCLCSFSMPVFASGTDPAPEPLPEIAEEEPTTGGMEPEGVSITPKGNATLVDDFYGDKQLITVTTKAGNYFYILIDRANEDKETSVHFLNQVDDADLLALLDEEPQTAEVCRIIRLPMLDLGFSCGVSVSVFTASGAVQLRRLFSHKGQFSLTFPASHFTVQVQTSAACGSSSSRASKSASSTWFRKWTDVSLSSLARSMRM